MKKFDIFLIVITVLNFLFSLANLIWHIEGSNQSLNAFLGWTSSLIWLICYMIEKNRNK